MPASTRKRKRHDQGDGHPQTPQRRSSRTARKAPETELQHTPPPKPGLHRTQTTDAGTNLVDGLLTPGPTPDAGRRRTRRRLQQPDETPVMTIEDVSIKPGLPERSHSDSALTKRATRLRSSYFAPQLKPRSAGFAKPELARNHVPPLSAKTFGLIQERFWNEPFQMLVAVVFLNRTKGMHAMPVFFGLIERWPTPETLALAPREEICAMLQHLGLQNQRAKGLIDLAAAWLERPPDRARRYRTLNYPCPGDGRDIKSEETLQIDDARVGSLEVAYLPRLGPYGWDSWRIFCRDRLLGLADDYNGLGAPEGFEPEWKRVLPLDKELRACLRWMWLRDGWHWNPEDGSKRKASAEFIARANSGNMLWEEIITAD